MAGQAFYRKWRSQTFNDLIGQEAVVRTLKNGLHSGRILHAYLFCGPRGTGKTSSARLLAKTVNCQNPQDGEPCNECLNCREITEGRSLDVIEIDAASNRGIDEIRDLRDKVAFNPGNSRYKVYILDEAHMLTEGAFNALLKTLEEPPPHVIFVLATTEANRVPTTIASRCQRIDFKRISVRDIIRRLGYVAEQEQVQLEPGAADLLARAASGGMRDALSLLDQAVAALGEQVTLDGVQQMLGLADPRSVRQLVEHIAHQRGAEGLHLINKLAEAGADLRQLSAQVAEYWRALMLAKAGADIVAVLDRAPEEAAEIAQLAGLFALEELSACARIFSQNDVGARTITIPQLAVELAFVDCLHLHRLRVTGGAAPPPVGGGHQPAAGARPAAPPTRPTPPAQPLAAPQVERPTSTQPAPPTLREVAASFSTSAEPPAPPRRISPTAPEPLPEDHADAADWGEAAEGADGADAAGPTGGLSLDDVLGKWELVKKACKNKSRSLAALLNNTHAVAVGGGEALVVMIRVEHDFHYSHLIEPESRRVVEWALQQILEVPCHARFLKDGEPLPLPPTPPADQGAASLASRVPQPIAEPTRPQPGAADGPGFPEPPATESAPSPANSSLPDPADDDEPTPLNGQNGHLAARAPAVPTDPLEEQVRRDPVVEEVIKLYNANLVEWKPLEE